MKNLLSAVAAAALVLPVAAVAGPVEDYEALREEIWQNRLDEDPLLAMQVGDPRGAGTLADESLADFESDVAEAAAFLKRLDAIDRAALPEALRVDAGILRRDLADTVDEGRFAHSRYIVITNRYGPQNIVSYLPRSSPLFSVADYESYIGRIEALPAVIAAMTARTKGAIARGLTQPCEPMRGYAQSVEGSAPAELEQSLLWGPFAERPAAISATEWDALQARGRAAIADKANPALRDFAAFYRADYEPKCRSGAPGIGATKGGAAYYEYLVRHFTTTERTADDIHKLGLSEVARIRAEMVEVAKKAGFESREAFIAHLRSDPQYYAKTPEELMLRNAALAKHIDGFMPRLFGRLPRQPYTVLPIPDALAPGNTTAYYEDGSLAAGTPGVYRVNTTALDQRPLWEIPALTVHEAVPGHHQQIALQQELALHPLRRFGTFFTAFVEGWGLYSERLGIEMGLYDTPAKEMGRLSYEMWRACRLVVDTGIHSKGWTKARAVAFMTDNTALSAANIDAEVNRYITWPGQALAYKMGELKIRELRSRAEAALGADFDLRAFHDTVLENGAVPLDVLETHVDGWIAKQKAKAQG